MGREFELKYRASYEQIGAIRELYGEFEPISMETTYYDTPRGDFSRLRWTLRRRLENGRSVCTLKVPLADGSGENGKRNRIPSKKECLSYVNSAATPPC